MERETDGPRRIDREGWKEKRKKEVKYGERESGGGKSEKDGEKRKKRGERERGGRGDYIISALRGAK